MKQLGKIQSKQGHQKHDYLLTLTEVDMFLLKELVSKFEKRQLEDGSQLYNALVSMKKFLLKVF